MDVLDPALNERLDPEALAEAVLRVVQVLTCVRGVDLEARPVARPAARPDPHRQLARGQDHQRAEVVAV
jgi:hypothetical protein